MNENAINNPKGKVTYDSDWHNVEYVVEAKNLPK